jgi:hypothetical protein
MACKDKEKKSMKGKRERGQMECNHAWLPMKKCVLLLPSFACKVLLSTLET